jgi:hypothetical protein
MELTLCNHVPFDECHLYGMADIHIGSPEFDEAQLRKDVDAIKNNPRARVVVPGDILDYVTVFSVQDVNEATMPPDEQEECAMDYLSPIAKKIELIMEGNHERRTKEHQKAIKRMAKRLGVKYQECEAVLKIPVGKKANNKPAVYVAYLNHGFGNGRTIGATANALDHCGSIVLADLYITAHCHRQEVHKDIFFVPDCQNGNVRKVMRYYVALQSFQGRTKFAQSKGLRSQPTGATLIRLSGKDKSIKVEI